MKLCECGCGELIPERDSKGRPRRFIFGHQNRTLSEKQWEHVRKHILRRNGKEPWNKGISYVIAKREVYAHKGTWMKAAKRVYGERCMRCGWSEATCDTHHIVPKSEGGQFTLDNAVVLCPNCHRLAHIGKVSTFDLRAIKDSSVPLVESR